MTRCSGADPENMELGSANSIKYQIEPGGANLFLVKTYKGNQGARPGCAPL